MKRLLIILLALSFCIGCAGGQITPEQENAICRSAGNALAIALISIKPEVIPAAKMGCELFFATQDPAEAQAILERGLAYLSDKYIGSPALKICAINVLQAIGWSPERAEAIIIQSVDEAIELEGFTMEMLRRAKLVAEGFCQMIVFKEKEVLLEK